MASLTHGRWRGYRRRADHIASLENPWNERTTFSYDSASRRTLKKLANGTRASFSYDAADRLTTLANMDSTAAYISRYDYEYDNADNRTAVLEADGSRVTWSYDAANQLLAENRTGTTPYVNTFSYDAAQNRLTKNESGARTTYSYDAANQLATSLDAGGTTTYTFDANGNQQIVLAPNGGRTTTTWDYENQPTKTVLPSGIINTASYNGDNLRKELQDSEGTKRFVWDGKQYLFQTDGSNATQAVWTNEPAEFTTLITQRSGGATQYPHFDALGSTRQLTDSNEIVTDTCLYDAWGNPLTHTGPTDFPFWFVGMVGYFTDTDTGATYIIARTYEPSTARWTATDPKPFGDGVNTYAYAENQPTLNVDPSGLITVTVYNKGLGVWRTEPCGGITMNFVFSLSKKHPCPKSPGKGKGYLIQHVVMFERTGSCDQKVDLLGPFTAKDITHNFYEAWLVTDTTNVNSSNTSAI